MNSYKKHNKWMLLFVIVLLVEVFANPKVRLFATGFAGGRGTENDPYIITNQVQLNEVRNNLSAHFKLGNDIYLNFEEGSQGWEPIGTFTGSFDGDGYEIKGLWISRRGQNNVGLFSTINNRAVIKNLGVILDNRGVVGSQYVGGLAGSLRSDSMIQNCYVHISGGVRGSSHVGGLVGNQNRSSIVYSYVLGNVEGHERTGGLVGYLFLGSIGNCYVIGDTIYISDWSYQVGGLLGSTFGGAIYNSFVSGRVIGYQNIVSLRDNVGSFIGYLDISSNSRDFINNYYNKELSSLPGAGVYNLFDLQESNLKGLTTAQMLTNDTLTQFMSNLDTDNSWIKREEEDHYYYPELRVFYGDGTLETPRQRASKISAKSHEVIVIEQPVAIRSRESLTLESPDSPLALETGGWQLSADGKTGWVDYNGAEIPISYDQYYLRYFVEPEVSLFSNVVQISVNKWKPTLKIEFIDSTHKEAEEEELTLQASLSDGVGLANQEIEFEITIDNETTIHKVYTDEHNIATYTIPNPTIGSYTFSASYTGNSENESALSDTLDYEVQERQPEPEPEPELEPGFEPEPELEPELEPETKPELESESELDPEQQLEEPLEAEVGIEIENSETNETKTNNIHTGDTTSIWVWLIAIKICMGISYKMLLEK